MNIGTKIGAKMAHLAEPLETKMLMRAVMRIKAMHMGRPVKPIPLRKSAPEIAMSVPRWVQLKRAWNWPQKKQKTT